jgi:hypothetical protein
VPEGSNSVHDPLVLVREDAEQWVLAGRRERSEHAVKIIEVCSD